MEYPQGPVRILALDPGANGAFVYHCPLTGKPMVVRLSRLKTADMIVAFLEQQLAVTDVIVYEDQTFCAGIRTSAPAMGKFGRALGFLEGHIDAFRRTIGYEFEVEAVYAREWMKSVLIPRANLIKKLRLPPNVSEVAKRTHEMACRDIDAANAAARRDWKRRLQAEAQRLFPSLTVTLAECDALLLMNYALQKYAHS